MASSSSSPALPAEVAQVVSDFEGQLKNIEQLVGRLQGEPWHKICGPDTPPLDSARMHLMIAYAANSLFWIYLRTQGVKTQNHPVRQELDRIKTCLRKVKEAEAAQSSSSGGGNELEAPAPAPKAAVAHRFVTAALGVRSAAATEPATSPAVEGGESSGSKSSKRPKSSGDGGGGSGKKRKKKA